jgi:hypothetical protein
MLDDRPNLLPSGWPDATKQPHQQPPMVDPTGLDSMFGVPSPENASTNNTPPPPSLVEQTSSSTTETATALRTGKKRYSRGLLLHHHARSLLAVVNCENVGKKPREGIQKKKKTKKSCCSSAWREYTHCMGWKA